MKLTEHEKLDQEFALAKFTAISSHFTEALAVMNSAEIAFKEFQSKGAWKYLPIQYDQQVIYEGRTWFVKDYNLDPYKQEITYILLSLDHCAIQIILSSNGQEYLDRVLDLKLNVKIEEIN